MNKNMFNHIKGCSIWY